MERIMTEKWDATGSSYPPPPPKKGHKFLWFFVAVQLLFIAWLLMGTGKAQTSNVDCSHLTPQQCESARDAGTAIGAMAVVFLWAASDIIIGVWYGIYRLVKRGK